MRKIGFGIEFRPVKEERSELFKATKAKPLTFKEELETLYLEKFNSVKIPEIYLSYISPNFSFHRSPFLFISKVLILLFNLLKEDEDFSIIHLAFHFQGPDPFSIENALKTFFFNKLSSFEETIKKIEPEIEKFLLPLESQKGEDGSYYFCNVFEREVLEEILSEVCQRLYSVISAVERGPESLEIIHTMERKDTGEVFHFPLNLGVILIFIWSLLNEQISFEKWQELVNTFIKKVMECSTLIFPLSRSLKEYFEEIIKGINLPPQKIEILKEILYKIDSLPFEALRERR